MKPFSSSGRCVVAEGVDIRAVANLAGVSIATVSRVQRGTAHVSRQTREKVLDAIERLGYRPNRAGRDLARQRTAQEASAEANHAEVALLADRDIVAARNKGRTLAAHIGLPERDTVLVLTAISELARNIVEHAGAGEIVISVIQDGARSGLEVEARDRGPGIADVELALREGYSSKDGLGMGLPGARRLMDAFEIESAPGKGTKVTVRKWTSSPVRKPPTATLLEWGIASRPFPGESESGDLAIAAPTAEHVLVAVVDGLGHGHEAAAAARLAVGIVEQAKGDVVSVALECHEQMRRSRGAAMSLASFEPDGKMTWLAIGNVRGRLVRANARSTPPLQTLPLLSGTVGDRVPPLKAFRFEVVPGDLLIVTTDGVRGDPDVAGVRAGSAQQIADGVLRRNAKTTDDALVFVGRYLASQSSGEASLVSTGRRE
jgi:anti-sigma regulatory factor (Ser/Thr protein kinase)